MLLKPKKNLVAVLDIGSYKTAVIVGKIFDNKIGIIACSYKLSGGIKNGTISDIQKAMQTIITTIEDAENICGESIDSVYIVISGCGMHSHYENIEVILSNNEVSEKELKLIINRGYEKFKNDEQNSVMHCLAIEYILDGASGIVNPIGMYGNCLAVKMHVVCGYKPALNNILNCLNKCHVNVAGYISNPYGIGFSCLDDDDKMLGVTVLDIGGGNTCIGVYKDNLPVYIDTIPIGGINITKDIACAFSLSISVAEKLKVFFIDNIFEDSDDTVINLYDILDTPSKINAYKQGMQNNPLITKGLLREVIYARLEEIFELIKSRLIVLPSTFPVFRKIIITGGTAKLDSMERLAEEFFKTKVEIGRQDQMHYSDIDLSDPIFAAATGAISCIKNNFYNNEQSGNNNSNRHNNIVKWLQKYF